MFLFGDTEETARTYLEYVTQVQGPRLPDGPADEMTEKELSQAVVWLHMAVSRSEIEGVEEALTKKLIEWYDEAFVAYCKISDKILDAFERNSHIPPTGILDLDKYRALAAEASES